MKEHGKVQMIPISSIQMKITRFRINLGIVAYLDILGFSLKRDEKDRESSQFDFAGALRIAATNFPMVRFNIFSDCAFLCGSENNADQLLSAIRYAFTQWTADGVLVRGGISLGSYSEVGPRVTSGVASNFACDLFQGSGVIKAARLEDEGSGALLYTNVETANFYARKYREPVFTLEHRKILGWTDAPTDLHWFTGISFIRLLMVLSIPRLLRRRVLEHLISNIRYSLAVERSIGNRRYLEDLMLVILASDSITTRVRKKAIKILGGKLSLEDLVHWEQVRENLYKDAQVRANMEFLGTIARLDSSIAGK
jgi:hypothetical protein